MSQSPSKQLLEKVPHITNTAPYSVHTTNFTNESPNALYMHFHPEYELLYLEEGVLWVNIGNLSYTIQSGEALFIPPNLLHSADALSGAGTFHAAVFSEDILHAAQKPISSYLNDEPDNAKHIVKLTKKSPWQAEALLYLEKIFFQSGKFSSPDIYVQSHLLIIWEYLYKYHISQHLENIEINMPIKNVLEFIHVNFQEELSLEKLTQIAHMSKEHLCRTFKKATGYTPFAYLKHYRILKSCHYLKNTDKKISEICSLCGFNNISYFNREFLHTMQTTPSRYRKRE